MSKYVDDLEKKEAELVRRKERKGQLEQLFENSGESLETINKNYSLSEEDTELLQEIEQEAKHQAQLDDAFLRGFGSVKH